MSPFTLSRPSLAGILPPGDAPMLLLGGPMYSEVEALQPWSHLKM